MGFRFRRRIKIIPGVWLNLSKSGVSTSIGGKGLTVNLKDDKTRTTASLPGTGMSYSTDTAPASGLGFWLLLALFVGLLFLLLH